MSIFLFKYVLPLITTGRHAPFPFVNILCALLFVPSTDLDEFKLFVHGMYVCTPTYVWNSKVKKEAKLRNHCEHRCMSQKVFLLGARRL